LRSKAQFQKNIQKGCICYCVLQLHLLSFIPSQQGAAMDMKSKSPADQLQDKQQELSISLAAEQSYLASATEHRALSSDPEFGFHAREVHHKYHLQFMGQYRGQCKASSELRHEVQLLCDALQDSEEVCIPAVFVTAEQMAGMDDMAEFSRGVAA